LRIIGDGNLRPELERMAEGRPVQFTGTVPNEKLPELLCQSRVFVLPSLYEGTPKALLEAMSCGLAVVATRTPGNSGVVEGDETGMLVERTAAAIARAITTLLSDSALRARLAAAAGRYVRERHSMEVAAAAEAALIRRLAAERGIALAVLDADLSTEQGRSEARQTA
jgi:glycosyltransferase involved in cell wall biosynthesis